MKLIINMKNGDKHNLAGEGAKAVRTQLANMSGDTPNCFLHTATGDKEYWVQLKEVSSFEFSKNDCQHEKVYDNKNILPTLPPKRWWKCRKCGVMGYDYDSPMNDCEDGMCKI